MIMDKQEDLQKLLGDSTSLLTGKKMTAAWQRLMDALAANPDVWVGLASEAQQKQMHIANGLKDKQTAVMPKKGDRRFGNEQWQDNPFFSFLMQNYLVGGETLLAVIEQADISPEDKKLLRFAAGQYVDAVAPTNFPMTNPEIMAEAAQSGGKNFADGMQNFMEDMQNGSVANTDKSAFELGNNIAITAGSVVMQNNLMQIIEYAPQSKQIYARPLLIVPPCINKYYILDLQKQNSFVAHAVAAGHRVFLISWINASVQQQSYNWDFYLREGVMTAIDTVRAISGQETINTLGFCIGGTLLASALAVLAHDKQTPAHSITLLAAMLDFSDPGDIGMFIDKEWTEAQEAKFSHGGLMDGSELMRGFSALRPNDLIWPYIINNYYRGKKPAAFDLLFWNADPVNLPGPMFAEYLRYTYLENRIAKKTAVFCDTPIDMAAVKIPVYAIACERDHIVPWRTAFASAKLLGGKKQFVLSAGGHIAGIVNPPAIKKGWHKTTTAATLAGDADKWNNAATSHNGSWWDHWLAWLGKNNGSKKVAAPKKQGNVRYAAIEPAPGSYVCASRPEVDGSTVQD